MKALLIPLFLIFSFLTYSQDNLFTNEWHEKLESDLEYIIFPNPSDGNLKVIVYRGKPQNHIIKITNTLGQLVYTYKIEREGFVDITSLDKGIYFFTISNYKKKHTQLLKIR